MTGNHYLVFTGITFCTAGLGFFPFLLLSFLLVDGRLVFYVIEICLVALTAFFGFKAYKAGPTKP